MTFIKTKYHQVKDDYKMVLRNVPSSVVTMFVVSVVLMNILANREWLNLSWVALDCGFFLSWLSFLCMDVITKRFGAKASILVSTFAIGVNLMISLIFFIIVHIPGNWAAGYDYPEYTNIVNAGLDSTFGGTWYVLLGSMIAMFVASVVNSISNEAVGKVFSDDSFKHFAIRSYVSTAVGQFVDNMVFALLVSQVFFGWSLLQCVTCSITGAVLELLCEVIFSRVGYKISNNWKDENVGQAYLEYIRGGKENGETVD